MLRTICTFTLAMLALPGPAAAKDCTAVETAPGVKTKPAGCSNIIPDLPPKKADDPKLKSSGNGWITYRDGTRVRVFGRVGTDVTVGR